MHPFYTLEEPDPAGVSTFIVQSPFADPDPAGHMQSNMAAHMIPCEHEVQMQRGNVVGHGLPSLSHDPVQPPLLITGYVMFWPETPQRHASLGEYDYDPLSLGVSFPCDRMPVWVLALHQA